MRKLMFASLMLATASLQIGCLVPIWSSSRDDRARQLIYSSESLRQIPDIWERIWFLDLPDLQTPYRTHGGVI